MATRTNLWQQWPALAGMQGQPLAPLRCERAVWGREPGPGAGFHWLATSAGFGGKAQGLEHSLHLGSEDVPGKTLVWRSSGSLHHAVHCYPSRTRDTSGRPALEKQVLEWRRPPDLPAALAALVLLPQVERLDDGIWWGKPADGDDFADAFHLGLPPDETSELAFDEIDLQTTIQAGCRELAEATDRDTLAGLYAQVLAGSKGIPLLGLKAPLSGAALAALLLPLPRGRADRINLVAWLPSRRADAESGQQAWDLILGGAHAVPTPPVPTDQTQLDQAQFDQAGHMAEALLACDPQRLHGGLAPRPAAVPQRETPGARRLVLWGLAAAGKTAYLAQLYLHLEHATDSAWRVYPGPDSLGFFRTLRARMQTQNRFPAPTPVDKATPVLCRLVNERTGAEALIEVEDRSGEDYRGQIDAAHGQLAAADGLILLFDPLLEVALQRQAFKDALDRMSLADARVGGRDTRPVAFCLAKADAFISTAEAYRAAIEAPDAFVRDRIQPDILQSLDHHFARYRLFPVSAAGVQAGHGAVTPAVFFDEDLNPRLSSLARPLHLLDPVEWILEQLAAPDHILGPR